MGESNNAVFDGRRENRSYALNSKANSFWLARIDNTDIDNAGSISVQPPINRRASLLKTNRKRNGLTIVIGVFFVVAIVVGSRLGHSSPEQIITLPNGDQYRFVGTTYSKENVPPAFLARLVSWLPSGLAEFARKHIRTGITHYNVGTKSDTPQLFIWFQFVGTKATGPMPSSSFSSNARLADEAGVQSGPTGFIGFSRNVAWCYVSFRATPRRSQNLQCFFYSTTRTTEAVEPFGELTFRNPLYGRFPQWAPEAVPSVKRVGDLEVRLNNLKVGFPFGSESFNSTGIEVSLHSLSAPGERWIPHRVELSDATGNILRGTFSLNSDVWFSRLSGGPVSTNWTGYSGYTLGTLWPDESAWKLSLELKRSSGCAPNELVTFKSVPIPPLGNSNAAPIVNTAGGIHLMLTSFVRRPNITTQEALPLDFATKIRIELPGKPKGVAIDFVDMTTDTGPAERYGYSASEFAYNLFVNSIPTNAHTIDITFAVQKTRSVEFLVKPPGAK